MPISEATSIAPNVQRFMTPRSRAKHGAGVSGAFPKLCVLVPAPVDAPPGAALHEPSRLSAVAVAGERQKRSVDSDREWWFLGCLGRLFGLRRSACGN